MDGGVTMKLNISTGTKMWAYLVVFVLNAVTYIYLLVSGRLIEYIGMDDFFVIFSLLLIMQIVTGTMAIIHITATDKKLG